MHYLFYVFNKTKCGCFLGVFVVGYWTILYSKRTSWFKAHQLHQHDMDLVSGQENNGLKLQPEHSTEKATHPLEPLEIHYNNTLKKYWGVKYKSELKIQTIFEDDFLQSYRQICFNNTNTGAKDSIPRCPCVPKGLVGGQAVDKKTSPSIQSIMKNNSEVQQGGYWKPLDCFSRDRVAIIIPFRDRQSHLNILLKYLHPLLQRQLIEYRIFVVEQAKPKLFGKASLMNAGYLEAKKIFNFDCVVFHDVDMIPEDDRNFYTCINSPRHVAPYVNKFNYTIRYLTLLGGALLFSPEQFEAVNGYSNRYYGWGGEDDDMSDRLRFSHMTIYRYPSHVSRYTMVKHHRDRANIVNNKTNELLMDTVNKPPNEGLNTVRYDVEDIVDHPLYTWIYINLPDAIYIAH